MGGTESKSNTQILGEIVSSNVTRNIQNCTSKVDVTQKVIAEPGSTLLIGKDASINQAVIIDVKCVKNTLDMKKLKQDIKNSIMQATDASGESILSALGSSSSQAYINLNTVVNNTVTIENIQNCASMVNNQQIVKAKKDSNLILDEGASINQTLNMMNNCYADMVSKIMEETGISNEVDQKAAAETTSPFAFIADIANAISPFKMLAAFFVMIILIVVAIFVYPMFKSSEEQYPQYSG